MTQVQDYTVSCASKRPLFSVVVPVKASRVESPDFSRLRLALQRQTFENFEVIVVVDGESRLSMTPYNCERSTVKYHFISAKNSKGVGHLRHIGMQTAIGRYVIFTDDDAMPPDDWLATYKDLFSKIGDALICGRDVRNLGGRFANMVQFKVFSFLWDNLHASVPIDVAQMCTSANCGFPRILGLTLGYYVQGSSADRAFLERWKAKRWPAMYVRKLYVNHGHALSMMQLLRQWKWYGRGGYAVQSSLRKEGISIKVLQFSLWLDMVKSVRHFRMKAAVALTQVAYVVGYIQGAIQKAK